MMRIIPFAMAGISGLLFSLAFPSWMSPGLVTWAGWIAWIALVPMMMALEGQRPLRRFLLGWMAGSAFFGSALTWIAGIAELEFLGIPAWVSIATALGLFWGFWALVLGWFGRSWWLAAPALWVLAEWFRSWMFTGFPWVLAGQSQWAVEWLFPSLRYAGVLGVSLAVVAVNAAIAEAIAGRRRIAAVGVAAGVLAVLAGTAMLSRAAVVRECSGSASVTIALLQGNFTEREKWTLPLGSILGRYESLARRSVGGSPSLVVWPETATASELGGDPATLRRLAGMARETRCGHLVGAILWETAREYYNAAFLLDRNGVRAIYRKQHLVPFGEYIPSWLTTVVPFARKLVQGMVDYTPGKGRGPIGAPGSIPIGVQVCYESVFSTVVRAQVAGGAELLVNITNDAWYGRSAATFQHALGPVSRAVETGRFVARCANTGLTLVASPDGSIDRSLGLFEPGVHMGVVRPLRGMTPYVRMGDLPILVVAALFLVVAAFSGRRGTPGGVAPPRRAGYHKVG